MLVIKKGNKTTFFGIISLNRKRSGTAYMYIRGALRVVWQGVRSCFGAGYWRGDKPWKNDEPWRNG